MCKGRCCIKTLVITNDYATQLTLEEVLHSRAHDITLCGTTASAWQVCQNHWFTLIILDLLMPPEDTKRFCECARSLPEGERIQIIGLSGSAFGADVAAALEWGVNDYLARPLDLKLLRVRLGISEQHAHDLEARREAELNLRQREKRFRALIENSLDGVVLLNAQGRAVYASPGFTRVLGYGLDEFIGTDAFDLVHPEDLPSTRAVFEGLLQCSGKSLTLQARAMHKNGSWRWMDAIACNMLNEPAVRAVVVNFRDITERKIAEETLVRSEARYRNLVETSNDLIWSVDASARWTFLNRNATRAILGYDPEELLGRPFTDLQTPAQMQKDLQVFKRIKDGNKYFNYETVFLRKDGVPVNLVFNAIAFRDLAGNVIGTTGTASDITQRKAAEDALRQSEARLRLAMNAAEMGSWTLELATGQLTWDENNFALYGVDPQSLTPSIDVVMSRVRPEDQPELLRSLQEGLRTGLMFTSEFRVTIPGGGMRWLAAFCRAVRDENGIPVRVYGINMDISERKQREEERRKLEAQVQHVQRLESLGVLAGGIAHDFNNLLVGILGGASLALLDLPADSLAREHLEHIKEAGLRATELTRQMMSYSGKGRFIAEPLQLNTLIESMGDLLRASISKKATLNFQLGADVPLIQADEAQIRQVVLNLVTNAADAIGENSGCITLRTGAAQADQRQLSQYLFGERGAQTSFAFLNVSDNGCGIDEATRARIFDPFFTTKSTGRGLGLATVLGILRGHHAGIQVHSEPGKGSSFHILFPKFVPEPASVSAQPVLGRGLHGKGMVLVVDDEEVMRRVVTLTLERLGFSVLTARDGKEGVELFSRHAAETLLVILDVNMPLLSGDEAFKAMRLIRPDVRVLLTSGYDQPASLETGAESGLAGFLQKPFRIETLIEKVGEALAEKKVLSSGS